MPGRSSPNLLPLCIRGALKPLDWRCRGPPFHTSLRNSTPLSGATVKVVGNTARFSPALVSFSKSPELHNRDLENIPAAQPAPAKPLRPNSHFSYRHYGCFCFLFISLIISLIPAGPLLGRESASQSPRPQACTKAPRRAEITLEFREETRFSTHT